jgi:hypothetical protein
MERAPVARVRMRRIDFMAVVVFGGIVIVVDDVYRGEMNERVL